MKKNVIIILAALLCTAQQGSSQKPKHTSQQNQTKMDTSKLTNATVKAAFDAWQNGDAKSFLSFFTADAKLYDDGKPRSFQSFIKEACGHEKFTAIDRVENDGKDIFGNFHTERWGDFKTYFKFEINAAGKIMQLAIGQAN